MTTVTGSVETSKARIDWTRPVLWLFAAVLIALILLPMSWLLIYSVTDKANHVKKIGLSRHIGISNFTVALIEQATALCPEPLACDQVEYHPYLDQTRLLDACAHHGMALVAYSPIAKGRIRNDQTLSRIGQAHGKTAAQVCLRWLVQQNVSAIPRTSKIERLSENIDIFDFELSDAQMRQIFQMRSPKGRLTDYGFAPKWD